MHGLFSYIFCVLLSLQLSFKFYFYHFKHFSQFVSTELFIFRDFKDKFCINHLCQQTFNFVFRLCRFHFLRYLSRFRYSTCDVTSTCCCRWREVGVCAEASATNTISDFFFFNCCRLIFLEKRRNRQVNHAFSTCIDPKREAKEQVKKCNEYKHRGISRQLSVL